MTKVSFYKLLGQRNTALKLACHLIDKACKIDQQVLCLVEDDRSAEQLDDLLWHFEPTAFIPHGRGVDQLPVAISTVPEPGQHHQLLINLQPAIPTWFSRFDRMIEVIYQQPDYEQAKRENFRFLKDRGYSLNFHDLGDRFSD